jgi:hypothetical protein
MVVSGGELLVGHDCGAHTGTPHAPIRSPRLRCEIASARGVRRSEMWCATPRCPSRAEFGLRQVREMHSVAKRREHPMRAQATRGAADIACTMPREADGARLAQPGDQDS